MNEFIFEKHGVDFCTPISNRFLLTYMPKASGSFVKVFLYLYVHFYHQDASLSPLTAANELGLTEADVMEALGYWQKEGLLSVVRNENTCRIDFRPCGSCPGPFDGSDPHGKNGSQLVSNNKKPSFDTSIVKVESAPNYSPEELELYQKNAGIARLFSDAQVFMGAPVNTANLSLLYSFYDFYRMPLDLIHFMMDYCAETDHRNFRYMEKLVQAWLDKGIKTLEDAQKYVDGEKRVVPVLALFGITNRKANEKELAIALNWLDQMKVPMDLIQEAASRTLKQTGKPSFPYADTILKNWMNSGITSAEMANKNDAQYGQTSTDYDAIAAKMQKKRFAGKN